MKKKPNKSKNNKLKRPLLKILMENNIEEKNKEKENREKEKSSQERMRLSKILRNKIAMMFILKSLKLMRELPMLILRRHSLKLRLDSLRRLEDSIMLSNSILRMMLFIS